LEKIQKILRNPQFLKFVKANKAHEKGRKFCKHNLPHFLDVARIGYILALESEKGADKEKIYAAALLHDIGKWQQYEDKTPHNISGAELCVPILQDAGFTEADIQEIVKAILVHRDGKNIQAGSLSDILFRADKLSRNCMFCKAADACKWRYKNAELIL